MYMLPIAVDDDVRVCLRVRVHVCAHSHTNSVYVCVRALMPQYVCMCAAVLQRVNVS
jgi:hypothetical protein